MDVLKTHFEQDEVWQPHLYLDDEQEEIRFKATLGLIPQDAESLMDVGAGNGAFLWHIEQSGFSGSIEGLEYSAAGINNQLCRATIRQGTIQQIGIADKSYGVATCLEVIEHLPVNIYQKGLRELERIAKKYIIVSVPHIERLINVVCPYCQCEFNPNTHVRSFDRQRLENLFSQFRMKTVLEVGTKKQFFMPFLQNELRRLFARKSYPHNLTCPQCQFKKPGANGSNPHIGGQSRPKQGLWEETIKRLLFVNKPKWYIVLYVRKNENSPMP